MRSFDKSMKALILVLIFFSGMSGAFAAPPTINGTGGSAYVTDLSAPWDNIGKIGDRVSYTVLFTSVLPSPNAFVVVPGVGNPILPMNVMLLGGNSYAANYDWTIVQGNVNNTGHTPSFIIGNASGTAEPSSGGAPAVDLDNVRPERNGIMTATVNGVGYTGTYVRRGQSVNFTQPMTTSDTGQNANLDLSAVGLTAANSMTSAGSPPTFTLSNIIFPDGLDATCNFPLTIVDGRGNISTFNDFSMNVDTRAPFISDRSVTNAAGVLVPALPGHILNFSMTISNYDNDTVQVTCASFTNAGIALPTLTPTTLPVINAPVTFTGTLLLPTNNQIYGNLFPFTFICTDNAGNVTTATANLFSIDLDPPVNNSAEARVYPPAPGISPITTLASISTQLQIRSEILAVDAITVVVDLSSIGGPAAFPMPLHSNSGFIGTYIGTYTIPVGLLENTISHIFNVEARDPSGNIVFRSTTPGIFIDNRPPEITDMSIIRNAGAGTIRAGDSVTVQGTVVNVEEALGGVVWSDLRALGGLASHPLTIAAGNSWQANLIVATGTLDTTNQFFRLFAFDDVNNRATFDSSPTEIDTEPPMLLLATYTSMPTQSITHPYVINGDTVTFRVTLASTPSNIPYDGQTVFIDLSSAGGDAAQPMTLQASGIYTCNFLVPIGNLTDGATFPLIIRDNAGNFPIDGSGQPIIASITIPLFDQGGPVITAFTATRDAGAGTVKIGDSVTFEATVSGVRIFEGGIVWSDLSAMGGPASATYINMAGNTWRTTATLASGAIDTASYVFNVNAYNRIEHQVKMAAAAISIDSIPPVMTLAKYTPTPAQTPSRPYVINGDVVKFDVRLASTTLSTAYDGQTVLIDLSSAGGSAAQVMTLMADETYT